MSSRQRGFVLLATLLGGAVALLFSPAVHAASAAAASDSAFTRGDSLAAGNLAASIGVPWNPPGAVSADGTLERVGRFPGLVVSWPLRQLGDLVDQGLVSAEDTKLIPKTLALLALPASHGLVLAPASLGDRTGIGLAARWYPPRIGEFLNVEWDGSTLQYSRTTLRAGYGPAWLEYRYDWRPEDRFFGLGLNTSPDDKSNYAAEGQHLLLTLSRRMGFGPGKLAASAWGGERSLVTRPGKGSASHSFDQVFPSLGGMVDLHEDYVTAGASLGYDARVKGIQHWVRGWRAGVTAQSFADQSSSQLLFPAADTSSRFTHLQYDAEVGYSFFMSDPRTLRLAARVIDQHLDRGVILLPDLSSLGGSDGLAGFEPKRFHDLDAATLRLTYLFPIGKHL
jgi:hypothetical protein